MNIPQRMCGLLDRINVVQRLEIEIFDRCRSLDAEPKDKTKGKQVVPESLK